jgi:hypothetical protein
VAQEGAAAARQAASLEAWAPLGAKGSPTPRPRPCPCPRPCPHPGPNPRPTPTPVVTLPPASQLPTLADYASSVKKARALLEYEAGAVLGRAAQATGHTPCVGNGLRYRVCNMTVCEGRCTGLDEVCIPNGCGTCEPQCQELKLAPFKLPLPKLLSLPNLTAELGVYAPKPKCSGNTAADWRHTDWNEGAGFIWACRGCPKGTMPGPRRWGCTACAPGSHANTTSGACERCTPGTFSPGWRAAACGRCPRATFQPAAGAMGCFPCPRGFFGAGAGATTCGWALPGAAAEKGT